MKVLLTGGAGFLGWHTRVRLRALTRHEVITVTRENWPHLGQLATGADAVIHIAGVNRGPADEVEAGNIRLAEDVAKALLASQSVRRIVYANSIQAGGDNAYGFGKAEAGRVLDNAARRTGAAYADVRLPHLFGEGGKPNYNSFVATFAHKVIAGESPEIADRPIALLHAQDAAAALINGLTTTATTVTPDGTSTTVQGVYNNLTRMMRLYNHGEIPSLTGPLDVQLFNTMRAAMFPHHYPIQLQKHTDRRGDLVEAVRSHGGQGQTFVSTTHPGVTRGEHFHLNKVERFIVIGGQARISLRKLLTRDVINFDVSGDRPVIIDMPTMWAHNITNTSNHDAVTLFWAHELFDPEAPDTFPEPVTSKESGS